MTMVQYCCAYGCRESFVKGGIVTFHSFPKDVTRRKIWETQLRRKNFKVTETTKICSRHFKEECFDRTKFGGTWLKQDAIPTIFNFPDHLLNKKIKRKSPKKQTSVVTASVSQDKGRPSWDPNHPDYVPNVFNFNVPKKSADGKEKKMNRLKERCHAKETAVKAKSFKRRTCCVPDCHSSNKEEKISFHEIPADNNRRLLWLKAIAREGPSKDTPWVPSQYSIVCQKHFKDDDFSQHYLPGNKIRKRLKPSAIPSLFLPKPSTNKIEAIYFQNTASAKISDQQENRDIDYISCSVPGCQSKSPRKIEHNTEVKYIPMFPVPHDDELFNKWKDTLKETIIELTKDHHICERHFLENDIERYHRIKTEDRDIIEVKKRLPTLKPDAVPIKFLKSSHSVSRNLTDKTSSALNSCDSGNSGIDSEGNLSENLSSNSIEEQMSHQEKCLSYSELIKNIQLVKKPSKSWSVVCTDEFTIFARWNNKFVAEKRLVIEGSLTVRVFLKDWEIEMTDLVDLTTVHDVSLLLEKVESYSMDSTC